MQNDHNDHEIMGQLERLAASFPWDRVNLWLCREPEGKFRATAHVEGNPKFDLSYIFGNGDDCATAVDDAIRQGERAGRDPQIAIDRKVAELREQIRKLEGVTLGLPPYVPNRELAQYVQSAVEIHATAEPLPRTEDVAGIYHR